MEKGDEDVATRSMLGKYQVRPAKRVAFRRRGKGHGTGEDGTHPPLRRRPDQPMNEQMYSAMPDETSMSKPDFAGTSKKVPAA